MNSGRQPGTARAMWIIGRLAIRRQLNFLMSVSFPHRAGASGEAKRSATPRKSSWHPIVGAIVFAFMLMNGMFIAATGLSRLSALSQKAASPDRRIVVSRFTYSEIVAADKALQQIRQDSNRAERAKYEGLWNRYVNRILAFEVKAEPLTEKQEHASLKRMRDVFSREGAAGFAAGPAMAFMVSAKTWPHAKAAGEIFAKSLGVILVLWIPLIVCLSLGTNNKDLGQVDWTLEWLFTFPASARAVFASRLFAYSLLNSIVWCFLLPFVVLVCVTGGFGIAAIAVGLIATVYIALLAGAITVTVEVALRKFVSPGRLKNLQALFTVLGTLFLMLFYAATFAPSVDRLLIHRAASMSSLWIWNPFSLPLVLAIPGALRWRLQASVVVEMVAVMYVATSLALLGSQWLTRDGLVRSGGPYQGARGKAAAASHHGGLRGIAAVELHLLARDRNLLIQVLFVPMVMAAWFLLIDPRMFAAALGNFRHAALAAFAVGAYCFVSSAIPILDREGKTLWHLLSLPYSLVSILLRKALFWAVIGVIYGVAVLALVAHFGAAPRASDLGDAFLALYGIALYAFIASGLGILATDVLETGQQGRMKPSLAYLYLILAVMYANVFYSPSLWTILAQLVLSTLLAFALWQKVKDACPYLLDPTDRPPRAISLADGMIAALAFFVVQAVTLVTLHHVSSASLTAQVTVAYVFAALSVACVVLLIFWYQKVPALWEKIGLLPRDAEGRRLPVMRGVIQGILWGGVAALGAVIYLHVLSLFPSWQLWKENAQLHSFLAPASQPIWLCALLVVAAPLFEEFLFRGLVFQGLRRSTGPALAVVGSAALFALVHPPIAVVPVFGLGIATAISFDTSGFLLAPILAHAVYNGSVLLLNRI